MRAAPLVLGTLLLAAVPLASAEWCLGARAVCVADDAYRDPSVGCDGTWWVTGAWVQLSPGYVYAWGERRDCANGWSGMGGEGVRAGAVLLGLDAEARWYQHASGHCAVVVQAGAWHAGGSCVAPPPAVPWGRALP